MEGEEKRINTVPQADDRVHEGDVLILLGENRDLDRIRETARNLPRA